MRKVAVVTAVFLIDFNELDEPSSQFTKCDGFDYFLFTNDKTKVQYLSSDWNIVEIDGNGIKNGVYLTKRVKWLTHEYLPDYDIVIWVDSFIVPNHLRMENINSIINVCLDESRDTPIFMRTQKFRCIKDDIDWCVKNDRISKTISEKVVDYIEKKENFSVNECTQTYWSSAIIKNNKNAELNRMSNELYNYISNICYRDQHILPVLFKKFNITCNILKNPKDIFIIKGKQHLDKHKYVNTIKA
jgi:hypothetical protein